MIHNNNAIDSLNKIITRLTERDANIILIKENMQDTSNWEDILKHQCTLL